MPSYKLREATGEIRNGAVVVLLSGVAMLIVGLLLASMAVFGVGWFSRGTADFRGKTNEINQINSGNYRIAAYNSFYDECAGIQTDEVRISNAEAALKSNTDTSRAPELQANLTAAQNQRAQDINQYNADARKADTKANFRASDLPYQIDPTEETTTCTA